MLLSTQEEKDDEGLLPIVHKTNIVHLEKAKNKIIIFYNNKSLFLFFR